MEAKFQHQTAKQTISLQTKKGLQYKSNLLQVFFTAIQDLPVDFQQSFSGLPANFR